MNKIMLNNILNLTDEDINNTKISLNIGWQNVDHFSRWYNNGDVDFAYHSHYAGKRNFHNGNLCFGFVRLPDNPDKWLLVTASKIISVPEKPGTCKTETLEEYEPYFGRLVIKYHRGNKNSRYVFNMEKIIEEAEIFEILPNIYEPIKFNGFENIHLDYATLKLILDSDRYQDYKGALKGVKAIYCLTDENTGKLYIGGTYGQDGIMQRWSTYIKTKTGGNVGLDDLYKKQGDKYFEDNIKYTILETFDKNTSIKKIEERENYWKVALSSRKNGYNKN